MVKMALPSTQMKVVALVIKTLWLKALPQETNNEIGNTLRAVQEEIFFLTRRNIFFSSVLVFLTFLVLENSYCLVLGVWSPVSRGPSVRLCFLRGCLQVDWEVWTNPWAQTLRTDPPQVHPRLDSMQALNCLGLAKWGHTFSHLVWESLPQGMLSLTLTIFNAFSIWAQCWR